MYLCRDITFSYLSTNIPPNKPSSLIIVTITLRLMSVSVFRRSPIDEALFINKSTTQKSLQNVFPENLFVLSKTYYNAYNSWLLSQFQILSKCTPSLGNTFQKKKILMLFQKNTKVLTFLWATFYGIICFLQKELWENFHSTNLVNSTQEVYERCSNRKV